MHPVVWLPQALLRVAKALQRYVAREAVLPTVGSVVGVAAITALACQAASCGDAAAVAPGCAAELFSVFVFSHKKKQRSTTKRKTSARTDGSCLKTPSGGAVDSFHFQ